MDQPESSGQPNQNSGPLSGLSFRGPASPDSNNESGEQTTPENGPVMHEITQEHPEVDKDGGKRERKGRRKINIEFIDDKSRRHITFSKRKSGIMKKVHNTLFDGPCNFFNFQKGTCRFRLLICVTFLIYLEIICRSHLAFLLLVFIIHPMFNASFRPTNWRHLQARKFCCSWRARQVTSTHLRPTSCSHSSPRLRART